MKRKYIYRLQLLGVFIYLIIVSSPLLGAFMQQSEKIKLSFSIRQFNLLGNSFKLGIIVTIISLILGFFCALFIANTKWFVGWRKFYFVISLPIPFYIYALSWMYMLKVLSKFWPEISRYSVSGIGACIFVESLAYFPIAVLFILIGMEHIDADVLRMASIYAKDNKAVNHIVVKSVAPYCVAAAGLICTLSVTEFSVPSMFQYNTYALDIFSVYSRTGSALMAYFQCIPLIFVLIVPIIWLTKNIKQFEIKTNEKNKYRLKITGITKVLSMIAFSISILQIFVPIVIFLITTGSFQNILSGCKMILEELNTSFWTAFFGAMFCVIISFIPAIFMKNNFNKLVGVILYTMAIPGSIQAMGLLKIVNTAGWLAFEKSIFITSWGCALKLAPFMVLWLCVARMRVDNKAIELAQIFATNRLSPIKIIIRTLLPGYIVGFAIAFFLIFAEEGIPLILMAPGKETVTVKIYNYLHYGASEYVSAFSVVVLLFIFGMEALLILVYKFFKGNKRNDRS